MPGKHVHFAVPSTPSSTFSESTLASSPGPSTPPPIPPMYLYPASPVKHAHFYPHPRTPSPSSFASSPYVSGQVQVHPNLALLAKSQGTPLAWDLTQAPETAHPVRDAKLRSLSPEFLATPATHPPLPSLTIICDRLPWPVKVTPCQGAAWSAPYVTVGDVLHCVYRTLRLPVTDAELHTLPSAHRQRVRDAYIQRCRRVDDPRARDAEAAKDIKRVDYLMEAHYFLGLSLAPGGLASPAAGHGAVWTLHIGKA